MVSKSLVAVMYIHIICFHFHTVVFGETSLTIINFLRTQACGDGGGWLDIHIYTYIYLSTVCGIIVV